MGVSQKRGSQLVLLGLLYFIICFHYVQIFYYLSKIESTKLI